MIVYGHYCIRKKTRYFPWTTIIMFRIPGGPQSCAISCVFIFLLKDMKGNIVNNDEGRVDDVEVQKHNTANP